MYSLWHFISWRRADFSKNYFTSFSAWLYVPDQSFFVYKIKVTVLLCPEAPLTTTPRLALLREPSVPDTWMLLSLGPNDQQFPELF